MKRNDLVPVEGIQSRTLVLRGVRVLLDGDLATLYGVPTRWLNEQVQRKAQCPFGCGCATPGLGAFLARSSEVVRAEKDRRSGLVATGCTRFALPWRTEAQ